MDMTINPFVGAAVALVLMASPSAALTIANQDPTEHEVTVDRDGTPSRLIVGPGQSIAVEEDQCGASCSVSGSNGEAVIAQSGDELLIQGGEVLKTQKE